MRVCPIQVVCLGLCTLVASGLGPCILAWVRVPYLTIVQLFHILAIDLYFIIVVHF